MTPPRTSVCGDWQRSRGFSQAVVTEGGRTVWMAGHTALRDAGGNSLEGDFDGQVRQTFRNLDQSLAEVGGSLSDVVSLSVYLMNAADWPLLVEIRRGVFRKDFPASAAVVVKGLAHPALLVEIQAVAVLAA